MIIWLLLGWRFVLGEFLGGPLMIVLLALLFRLFLESKLVDGALKEAKQGRLGSMEGHAEMEMSVQPGGRSVWRRVMSLEGFTATSNSFVMDRAVVYRDVFGGVLVAGALAAWVPDSVWRSVFFARHNTMPEMMNKPMSSSHSQNGHAHG